MNKSKVKVRVKPNFTKAQDKKKTASVHVWNDCLKRLINVWDNEQYV